MPCQNASSSHPSGSRTPSGTRPARQRGLVWRIVRLGAGACFIRYGVRACRRGRNPAPPRSPRLCRCRRCDQRDGDQGTHPTAAVTTVQRSETLSKAAAVGLFASIGGKNMAQYASWVKSWAGSPMTARDGGVAPAAVRSESQRTTRTGKSPSNGGWRLSVTRQVACWTRPDLWVCGGAPRRNRTGDPILTIDARRVHNALQHLTCPHSYAGERRCRGSRREAGRG